MHRGQCHISSLPVTFSTDSIKSIVMSYFQELHMPSPTPGHQQLEVGIAMGCSISPTLFIAAFKVSLTGARQVMGGVWLPVRWRLPPLRSYLDDITRLLQTAPCTFRPLKRRGSLHTGRAGIGCGSEPYYLRRYEDGAGGVQAEGDGTGGAGLLDNVEEG